MRGSSGLPDFGFGLPVRQTQVNTQAPQAPALFCQLTLFHGCQEHHLHRGELPSQPLCSASQAAKAKALGDESKDEHRTIIIMDEVSCCKD
jgi:hypothetical protein